MKVADCRQCHHMRERRYSTYHEPRNYHPIGMSHVYAWCEACKLRCSEVKKRDCVRNMPVYTNQCF